MSKKYGFSDEELMPIWDRDMATGCVYCGKPMKKYIDIKAEIQSGITEKKGAFKCEATIEHLHHEKPFYKDEVCNGRVLKLEGLAICCRSCNSSRGKLELRTWFSCNYCKDKDNPISEITVAKQVREYLKQEQKYAPLTVVSQF